MNALITGILQVYSVLPPNTFEITPVKLAEEPSHSDTATGSDISSPT
jgi:hypothetical protein